MDTKLIYQAIAGIYDLLDVVYFRDEKRSPRKAVLAKIEQISASSGLKLKHMSTAITQRCLC